MLVLEAREVAKQYQMGQFNVQALVNVAFAVYKAYYHDVKSFL